MRPIEDNIIAMKSKSFAVKCIRLRTYLCEQKHEFDLSRQLLRNGTSIGGQCEGSFKRPISA